MRRAARSTPDFEHAHRTYSSGMGTQMVRCLVGSRDPNAGCGAATCLDSLPVASTTDPHDEHRMM